MNLLKEQKAREKKIISDLKKNRDRDSFIGAYDMYVDGIYRFIYFKVGNVEEAQDLTSSVFLKTWNYIREKGIDDHKSLKSLAYKIARNTVIDFYRMKSSAGERVSMDDILSESGGGIIEKIRSGQDVAEEVGLIYDLNVLKEKLFELKDEYREIITLRFIEDLSVGEIAESLNKTKGGVSVQIYRALRALRNLVENQDKKIK